MSVDVLETQYMGNKRVKFISFNASHATDTIVTGLKRIDCFTVGYVSLTTFASMHLVPNSGPGGTAALGSIGASGFTVGDELFIVAYGK